MFPLQNIDAVKLCLLNEPIYHGKLTPDAVSAKLQNPGDFLVQDGENSSSVLLSIFKDGIRDFLITIEKVEESPRFLVGRRCFASLEELTFNLKSVQCGSEEIRLETAIYRVNDYGRLGAHCFVDLPPRTTMKTMIPLPTIKYKSVLVALKREIIHEEIEEELESLMLLKHKHLVRLEDFAMYPHGSVILRYEMHDSTSLYDTMRKKEFGVGTTLAWVQQVRRARIFASSNEQQFECNLEFGRVYVATDSGLSAYTLFPTGTQVCLVWYVVSSVFSLIFGMRSTLTWLIVPICVVVLGVYAIISKRHKYLYPFLIITIVQQLVCVLMATIILLFSLVSFDTMRQIIGHSLDFDAPPSRNVALAVIGGTVAVCLLLSFVHIWQAVVIYRCLEYYEAEYSSLDDFWARGDTTLIESRFDVTDSCHSRPFEVQVR
ncbi:hypothetical protein Y032_0043g809 [Ancylostoma ceylanicum]|uniref:SH2 domain-containing protein n=1 Tax=Ancylostoma ceylanicum TaxID=53326 RepID=A0A016UG94_9BILA|nr:hypothetical protein Y032_0043g809 [Ancylostoma ceylanicum]